MGVASNQQTGVFKLQVITMIATVSGDSVSC